MKIKKQMIKREIAGETMLVPIAESVKTLNGLFVMTETGSFIWDILEDCETQDEIVDRLLDEYEIDRQTAEKDVDKFLSALRSYEII